MKSIVKNEALKSVCIGPRKLKLYTFHEIPIHLKDNPFIFNGYRAFYSFKQCLKSLWFLHNESVNIWSHLFGSLLFLGGNSNIIMFYRLSAATCLLCSSTFHTFNCHYKPQTYDNMAITDYSGIAVLFCGSFTSLAVILFRSLPFVRNVCLAFTSFASIAAIVFPWFPFFRVHRSRSTRSSILILLGACATFSLMWGFMQVNLPLIAFKPVFLDIFLTVLFYVGGAGVYVSQFPECLFPGKFDNFGSSHQLWHFCVIIAALSFSNALQNLNLIVI